MNEFTRTWNQSFKNYAIDIARIYKKEPEHIIDCLRFESVSGSLNETYLSLVKEKELVPIENLSKEDKERIWNKAKELSNKKERCIQISRSIYLLEMLT